MTVEELIDILKMLPPTAMVWVAAPLGFMAIEDAIYERGSVQIMLESDDGDDLPDAGDFE